jgi:hypothetical protein
MSRFSEIDPKLTTIANQLSAKLSIDRDWDPSAGFEERRIDWVENDINKAIIIQPTFESTGVNTSIWNFNAVAWIKINGIAQKPGWKKKLVSRKDFIEIESQIDILLIESVKNLKAIKIEDLTIKKNT